MNHDRARLIRELYDAFNRRDIEAVLPILAEDVDWPNVAAQSRLRGHDEVRAYWLEQFARINPNVTPTDVTIEGDRAIAAVHQVIRDLEGNVLADQHIAHAYTFRGPLVASMQVYTSVEAART